MSKSFALPGNTCAAGVYTSPILLPLCAHLLDSFDALDKLENFVSGFGRRFYRREVSESAAKKVTLQRTKEEMVPERWALGAETVVSFWAGLEIGWKIVS